MSKYLAPARAVLWMILKRIWHNHRLVLATLLGFTVSVGVVTSIPLFVSGALTRVLEAELTRDTRPGIQPAAINVSHFATEERPTKPESFDRLDAYMAESAPAEVGVPVHPYLRYGALDVTAFEPEDPMKVNPTVARWLILAFATGVEESLQIVDGRMYRPGLNEEGQFEAIVAEPALDQYEFTIGSVFLVPVARGEDVPKVPVRVVGAFKPVEHDHLLFPISGPFDQAFLMDEQTFRQAVLTTEKAYVHQYIWYMGIDEQDVNLANLEQMLDGILRIGARAGQMVPDTQVFASPMDAFMRYARKAFVLRLLLLVLSVPLLCLTAYYLLVAANLMVDRQRSEIAVIRSRGAGMAQIAAIYLIEGALYSGAALLLGPWLGVLLARVMGAAAGFVQFVDRKPLPILFDERVYQYGAGAVLLALVATLIPGMQAARESIVTYKMQAARQNRAPFWQRYFLDFLLLAASLYGYYTQRKQFTARMQTVTPPDRLMELVVDPLHFVLPALFIGSLGLILLRMLPYLTALVDRVPRRWGNASLHLAFAQVARSPNLSAPVILLLTLTVGLGLYSASAARTLEQNYADKAFHSVGADAAMAEAWEYDEETGIYTEPPFYVHNSLPGVQAAARVFIAREVAALSSGNTVGRGQMMAIDTEEFARVARFRTDLYAPYHPNHYLNLLGKDEEAVLVHPQFLERNKLQPGDRITLRAGPRELNVVIYGSVYFWPALYGGVGQDSDFFITNLDYVKANYGLLPYKVWFRLDPGVVDLRPLTEELAKQGIYAIQTEDARQLLTARRRDPQRTGLYGVLTIGFVVSAVLTVLGFLLYAVLSLRSRLLQLGVLRAIGLSAGQLLTSLGLEQAYTVGIGMAAGTGLGLLSARLFVPFLQLGGDLAEQIPPFRIVTDPVDRFRLYAVLGVMLLAGLVSLIFVVSRMQINQAVKLGEDS